jgi:hypothetical protein
MKTSLIVPSLILTAVAFAQDTKPSVQPGETPRRKVILPTEEAAATEPAKANAEEAQKEKTPALELKFKSALTRAVLDGRFCMIAAGKMGPDKEEKYTITGVEKTAEGQWTITAKIEYGGLSFDAPVPVQVKWAGDTPVIIVDNVGFPGTAKYSARVMIYGDTYAGTWSGGDHGGLMHGVIRKLEATKKAEDNPSGEKKP